MTPPAESPRLLIVEDDGATVDVLRELLADRADIRVARDGADALREWEEHRPHAVVLDLRLPGPMDGLDVFQQIRHRRGSAPPTLLLSGSHEAGECARALNIPLIRKPFDANDLVRAVADLLAAPA